ncbi:MAG: winged helix-turn-helix domain-containing protein [Paraclostridium sp.]
MEELRARINVILKNMGKIKKPNILEFKDLSIDMKTKSIYRGSEKIDFNEKLYSLMEYLVINKGILLFKEQIFDNICGYNSDASTDIVEVYISRLRKQLRNFDYDKYIITKRGMGYILDENIGE